MGGLQVTQQVTQPFSPLRFQGRPAKPTDRGDLVSGDIM